jgi:hypothetical protein
MDRIFPNLKRVDDVHWEVEAKPSCTGQRVTTGGKKENMSENRGDNDVARLGLAASGSGNAVGAPMC